jgi:subtilisin family serine protease
MIGVRRTILLLTLAGALLLAFGGVVLAQARTPQERIPGRYIVVLNDNVRDPAAVADKHTREHGLQLGFVYRYAINGYSAVIPENRMGAVESDPRVTYVEPDGVVWAVDQVLPWGINRIDADLSSTKAGDGSGEISNVNAYVIDSGVDASHPDLNVVGHVNFRGDGKNFDCSGHGTHVAGTVAARDNTHDVVGVAPGAPITGVKVLGCDGTGSWSGVIKGVDWVTKEVIGSDGIAGTSDDKKPAIANMSLGGARDTAVNDAVRNSANSGVFYSIAAGNDSGKACAYSPASAGRTWTGTRWIYDNGIMTVAATNSSEEEASWSNYGDCIDIWAPGVNVRSTKKGGGSTLMSGTSMAAPHVGGGGALYLSSAERAGASPLVVEETFKATAVSTGTKSKDDRAITRLYVRAF